MLVLISRKIQNLTLFGGSRDLNRGQNWVRIGSEHAHFPINNDKRLKTRIEYLFLMRNLMLVLISRKIQNLTHLGSPRGSKLGSKWGKTC